MEKGLQSSPGIFFSKKIKHLGTGIYIGILLLLCSNELVVRYSHSVVAIHNCGKTRPTVALTAAQ